MHIVDVLDVVVGGCLMDDSWHSRRIVVRHRGPASTAASHTYMHIVDVLCHGWWMYDCCSHGIVDVW